MAVELADAYVSITASAKGISKSIGDELGNVDGIGRDAGDRTSKGFLGNFTAGLGGLAVAVGGAFAAIGVGTFLKGTIDAASDLNETVSKVGVIFGKASPKVEAFAETADKAFGQSKQQALDGAATFATFGKSAGLTGDQLAGFSTDLVGLAGDLGSFFNDANPEDAINAIGSALRGESEPIRAYGVLLDDATLRNRALKLGLISTTKDALTPQQKVLAAQAEIFAQTTDAQGDFARTSDGLAGSQKQLSAQFSNVKATIGQALLPVMSTLVGFVSDKVLPAFLGLGDKVGPIFATIGKLFEGAKTAFSGEGVTSDGLFGVFERIGVIAGQVVEVIKGIDFKAVFAGVVDFITPIVDALGGLAATSFDLLKQTVSTLIQLFKDNKDTIVGVLDVVKGGLTAAIEALSKVTGFLADHMGLVKAIAIPLIAAFVAYKIVVGTIQVATTLWSVAQAALNVIMSLNPLGIIIALIAALVAGVIYAYTHFDTFRAIIDTVWQVIQTVFHWIADHWPLLLAILLGPFGVAILVVVKNFDAIKDAAMGVWNWVSDNWPLLLAILTGPVGLAVLAIVKNWDTIKDTFTSVKDWIWGRINDIVSFFTGIPGRIWASVTWIGDTLKNGITAAKDWIWEKINDIVGFYTGMPGRLAGVFVGMFDGIYNAFKSAINWVIDAWNGLSFGIPGFDPPGPGPTFPGFTIGVPRIPRLAAGAVVTQKTLAMIGEKGPEAVIPLDKFGPGGFGGGVRDIIINTLGKPDAHELAREVAWQQKTAGV